jgi:hypothetical protein
MKLIAFTPFPPGAFPYSQVWQGKQYNFPDIGLDIVSQAAVIFKFRKANGLPNATLDQTIEDLNVYTCQRLGNDLRWCGDGTNVARAQQTKSSGCRGCGAVV